MARRILAEVWPEGLAEFEARVQAHGAAQQGGQVKKGGRV